MATARLSPAIVLQVGGHAGGPQREAQVRSLGLVQARQLAVLQQARRGPPPHRGSGRARAPWVCRAHRPPAHCPRAHCLLKRNRGGGGFQEEPLSLWNREPRVTRPSFLGVPNPGLGETPVKASGAEGDRGEPDGYSL